VGADGVFEPEVEGEEATQEGTPRWAQLIEALLDHGIDGTCTNPAWLASSEVHRMPPPGVRLEAGWRVA